MRHLVGRKRFRDMKFWIVSFTGGGFSLKPFAARWMESGAIVTEIVSR